MTANKRDFYSEYGISDALAKASERALARVAQQFDAIDRIAERNQWKVLDAMRKERVSEACLNPTTGYGYNDIGRDTLERVYARIFCAEDALVRAQIASGTHAIAIALSGNLRPGDGLLLPAGGPYDTLEQVIGLREASGSLVEQGVQVAQVDLKEDGGFDYDAIAGAITENTHLAAIQRSRGYQSRPSFSNESIGELIAFLKKKKPDIVCFVDNCYGEFTCEQEPTEFGADLVAGSLIKNPGGGLAPSGGYITGRADLIERAAFRMTAPGIGREVGASNGANPLLFQGLFFAPIVTAAALKGAVFAAALYEDAGFSVCPGAIEPRYDIIQSIELGSPEAMIAFCAGIQSAAPVDAFVVPEPSPMPGYEREVIMAAGTFVQGSSIEQSADGPLAEPYTIYYQGGLTWPHAKLGVLASLQKLCDAGLASVEEKT